MAEEPLPSYLHTYLDSLVPARPAVIGLEQSETTMVGDRPEIYNALTLMGLYAVNFLVVMLTVLASVDTVAGEIASFIASNWP